MAKRCNTGLNRVGQKKRRPCQSFGYHCKSEDQNDRAVWTVVVFLSHKIKKYHWKIVYKSESPVLGLKLDQHSVKALHQKITSNSSQKGLPIMVRKSTRHKHAEVFMRRKGVTQQEINDLINIPYAKTIACCRIATFQPTSKQDTSPIISKDWHDP